MVDSALGATRNFYGVYAISKTSSVIGDNMSKFGPRAIFSPENYYYMLVSPQGIPIIESGHVLRKETVEWVKGWFTKQTWPQLRNKGYTIRKISLVQHGADRFSGVEDQCHG